MSILQSYMVSNFQQSKNHPVSNCDEMLHKIDIKDISNISHNHHIIYESFNYSHLEQKLTTTAKTLLYLFSPEIDLLQSLENKVQHYDKFQRTKLILKQLINSVQHYRFDRDIDMMKTQEEISKISNEFEHLKNMAEHLQKEGHEKDKQIESLKMSIIKLTKAYQQVRQCYEEELLELKFSCEELKVKLKNQVRDTGELSRSKKYDNDYSINLKIPKKERKRKQSHKYTDRNMYVRFSASHLQQSENVLTSMTKGEQSIYPNLDINNSLHVVNLHQLQLEKETLETKLYAIEQEFKKLGELYVKQTDELNSKNEELQMHNSNCLQQLKARDEKIAEKNKLINELLEIIQHNS